ncbi:hypothetical protein F5X97DRAFT_307889 [Nemania serpens]|nr:hypothetical protein F5X97DRAFT_307889 [Nemania serpens]
MNRLPQEIYDQIATLLQGPDFDRPALATISRHWQAAIERLTFSCIYLRSNDLVRFDEIVRNGRRRYVKAIKYLIVLPAYSDEVRCRFEREDDRRVNDEAFTVAIHRLFHLLQYWDAIRDGYVEFSIEDVYSPSDYLFLRCSSPLFDIKCRGGCEYGSDDDSTVTDLWSWRYRYSFIRLLRPSVLPLVPVVCEFRIHWITRNLCDRVPIEIAARLPNIRMGCWLMNDWSIRYLTVCRSHRRDLAEAVAELLPRSSSLEDISFIIPLPFYCDYQNFSVGSLHPEDSTRDSLSNAIRTATAKISTLRRLKINGAIDKSVFWPGPTHAVSEPYWQNLEHLTVRFSPRRPSGGHYFVDPHYPTQGMFMPSEAEVPPGYKQTEEEEAAAATSFSVVSECDPIAELGNWRWVVEVVPDDSLMPLIEAFGQACLQMPMLKAADLSTIVPAPTGLNRNSSPVSGRSLWGIWYFSPGTMEHKPEWMDPAFSEDIHRRRLIWDVKDWRPDADLQSLLGNIGREKHGEELVEKFIDSWKSVDKDRFVQEYTIEKSSFRSRLRST